MNTRAPHYLTTVVSSISSSLLGYLGGLWVFWRLFPPDMTRPGLPTVFIPYIIASGLSAWCLAVIACVLALRLQGAEAPERTGLLLTIFFPLGVALGFAIWSGIDSYVPGVLFSAPFGREIIIGSHAIGVGMIAVLARYLSVHRGYKYTHAG